MSQQIAWHVELEIRSGQLDSFRALTAEMVDTSETESGTLVFERFVTEDGNAVHIYERYTDSDAALVHLRTFQERFSSRFSTMITRRSFVVMGNPSAELRELLDNYGVQYAAPLAGFAR